MIMKNFRILIAATTAMLCAIAINAQEFATPSFTFSKKKPMYVTMQDGTEFEGMLKKFKYEKGLIEELILVDSITGKKNKIAPEKIAHFYAMPSGMDKLARKVNFASDMTQWNNPDIAGNIINKGYVYFEQTEVIIKKKKTEVLLMQLLNPTFSKSIKVYHDPRAKESASIGVAGVNVAGGDAKSYYIKKGDTPAVKVEKKTYKDTGFASLFADCEAVNSKYGSDISWFQVTEHVVDYTAECE